MSSAYAGETPIEGFTVTDRHDHSAPENIPGPDEASVPELEADETIAPRPEEEIAEVLRSEPDLRDHAGPDPA